MRHRACAWLALSSLAAFATLLQSATRPRYGGTLTVQLASAFTSLDPTEPAESRRDSIAPLLFETLVGANSTGNLEPLLATAWQHDVSHKRWQFTLRPKVVFHDGKPLSAASVVPVLQAALKKRFGDVTVTGSGQMVVVQSESSLDDLPAELSLPRCAVFHKGDNNQLIGTGPFRLDKWEPGRRAVLAAFDEHWAGRPYVDSVIVNLGPLPRQLSAGAADIWDLPVNGSRRVLPDAIRTWTSAPSELVAIAAANVPTPVQQALALAVDRAPIVNVLAQRKGEAAGGLLPQWLTGYAFLFPVAPDQTRAKQLLASLHSGPLTLSYPPDDGFAHAVADRISLNARDVGLIVQPTTNTNANLRLVRIMLPSANAALDLAEMAAPLGFERPANWPGSIDALYQAELAHVNDRRAIPLVYLPSAYGIGPRVHDWDPSQNARIFALHLESVWVSP